MSDTSPFGLPPSVEGHEFTSVGDYNCTSAPGPFEHSVDEPTIQEKPMELHAQQDIPSQFSNLTGTDESFPLPTNQVDELLDTNCNTTVTGETLAIDEFQEVILDEDEPNSFPPATMINCEAVKVKSAAADLFISSHSADPFGAPPAAETAEKNSMPLAPTTFSALDENESASTTAAIHCEAVKVKSAAADLFSSSHSADPFGTLPAAAETHSMPLVAPTTISAPLSADLFAKSALASNLFSSEPPTKQSIQVASKDLFGSNTSSTADLFSSIPPAAFPGNIPVSKIVPKNIQGGTPFSSMGEANASPFDGFSSLPTKSDTKSTTKIANMNGAANLFASTNSAAELFGSAPNSGPLPTAAPQMFSVPPPPAPLPSTKTINPAVPPSISIPQNSPNKKSDVNSSGADQLFSSFSGAASHSSFDPPAPLSTLASDIFGSYSPLNSAPLSEFGLKESPGFSVSPCDSNTPKSSSAGVGGASDLFVTPAAAAVSPIATIVKTSPSFPPPSAMNRSMTAPVSSFAVGVTTLNRIQSAESLFGETSTPITANSSSADPFGSAPPMDGNSTVTSVLSTSSSESVPATPTPLGSAPLSSSSNSGKTMTRTGSSGAIFKGKAALVTGASPFDAPPSSTGQKDLFPQAATASNPFDAISAPAAPGNKQTAWDIFSSKVPPAPAHAHKSSNPVDLFSTTPSVASSVAPTVTHSVPAGGTSKVGGGRAVMNAAEIFSRIPPPNKNPVVDFSTPPPAPGVRVQPKPAPVAVPTISGATADIVIPSPVREALSPAKPPLSNKITKSKLPAHLLNAIPGAIPTPHGMAAPPATASTASATASLPVFGGMPMIPPSAPSYKVNATPLVNPNKLTSLVQVVPEEELVDKPPVTDPAMDSAVNTVDVTPIASIPQPHVKGRYIKPASAIVAFGFGGKCLTMIPNSGICPPVYTSASKQPQNRILTVGIRPSILKGFRVVDLMGILSGSFYKDQKALPEVLHWKKLVADFPLLDQPSVAKDHSHQLDQKLIHFIRECNDNPSSNILSERLVACKVEVLSSSTISNTRNNTSLSANAAQSNSIIYDLVESEKLLWNVMEVVLRFQGQLASSKGSTDNTSPEYALVQLLLQQHQLQQAQPQLGKQLVTSPWSSFHPPASNTDHGALTSIEIEHLLVSGRREEALTLAVDRQDWPLALMLASIAGAEKYQEVTKMYAQQAFPVNSAMQLLSLVYSNQAQEFISTNGQCKPKLAGAAPGSGKSGVNPPGQPKFISTHGMIDGKVVVDSIDQQQEDPAKKMGIFGQWRYHLAALLSNKTSDWESLVRMMGNRLLVDYDDHFAASIAYLAANVTAGYTNPSGPPIREEMLVDMSLIGHDRSPHHSGNLGSRLIADCLTIACLRRSEIVEYALSKKLSSSSSSVTDDVGSGKQGIASSVFGWFTSSNSTNNNSSSSKSSKDPLNKQKEAVEQERSERFERLTKLRVALCPHRIRFAMILADYGLIHQALHYSKIVNQLVKDIHDDLALPPNKRKYIFYSASPFPKKFVRALDELMDRFGLAAQEGAKPELSTTTNKSGGSFWGLSSVINTNTLKEIMDGPPAPPTSGASVAVPPIKTGGPPKATTSASAPPPMGNPYVPSPFPNTPAGPSGQSTLGHMQQPPATGAVLPPVSFSLTNNTSNIPPAPSGNVTAPPSLGFPPMPAGRQTFQRTPSTASMNHLHVQQQDLQFPANPGQGSSAAAPPVPSMFVPGNKPAGQTLPQPQSQHPQPSLPPQPQQPPPTQENNSNKEKQSSTSGKEAKELSKVDKDKDPLGAGQGGIVGNLRKGLMQWFYPDAHDASENIGKSLEAYYDNKLGRWVFPGEEDAAQNSAALKPPPTGPMPGINPSVPVGSAPGMPGPGAPGTTTPSAADAPYDPLAALMAPPPRALAAPAPSMADDPLAAMMAPPTRMPGRPMPGGGMGAPPIGGGPTGGPPGATNAPPVNKFSVWKPPPVASNPTPSTSAFYMPPMPEPASEPVMTENTVALVGASEGSGDPNSNVTTPPPPTNTYMFAMPAPPADFAPPEAF